LIFKCLFHSLAHKNTFFADLLDDLLVHFFKK
jgi:hypothetical protein